MQLNTVCKPNVLANAIRRMAKQNWSAKQRLAEFHTKQHQRTHMCADQAKGRYSRCTTSGEVPVFLTVGELLN